MASQPRGMDIFKEDGTIITASVNEVTVIQDNKKASVMKVNYEPSSVSVSQENHVAVGGILIKTNVSKRITNKLYCRYCGQQGSYL